MRVIKMMLSSAGMLLATVGTAMATPPALLQDPVKIDVHTTESHTVWYASPMWMAIGAIVVVLFIMLAVMAMRGRDSGPSTTVIK